MSIQENNYFDLVMNALKKGRIDSWKQLNDYIDFILPDVKLPGNIEKLDGLLDVFDDDDGILQLNKKKNE